MVVRWGTTILTHLSVSVNQGRIISLILFNMYMDDLSITLNNSGIGGYLGDLLFYSLFLYTIRYNYTYDIQ